MTLTAYNLAALLDAARRHLASLPDDERYGRHTQPLYHAIGAAEEHLRAVPVEVTEDAA